SAATATCLRSLHDALPISRQVMAPSTGAGAVSAPAFAFAPPEPAAFQAAQAVAGTARLAAATTATNPRRLAAITNSPPSPSPGRSEEHTSELQSRVDLVCR